MAAPSDDARPPIGIRRWGDACFHPVEEEVPEGYIIGGVLIPRDEVMETREIDPNDPTPRPARVLRMPPKPPKP